VPVRCFHPTSAGAHRHGSTNSAINRADYYEALQAPGTAVQFSHYCSRSVPITLTPSNPARRCLRRPQIELVWVNSLFRQHHLADTCRGLRPTRAIACGVLMNQRRGSIIVVSAAGQKAPRIRGLQFSAVGNSIPPLCSARVHVVWQPVFAGAGCPARFRPALLRGCPVQALPRPFYKLQRN